MLESVDCVFCGSSSYKTIYSRKDARYLLDDNVYKMNRCKKCKGLYLSPRVREDSIWKYYPDDFYSDNMSPGQIMKQELRKNVAKFHYLKDLPPGKLLDVGCRNGAFINFMRQFDWHTNGYERNPDVANRFNCEITYGEFAQLSSELYDVITLWAVFEHLYQPEQYLRQIHGMLNTGGRLILQVPKFNSFSGRILADEDVPRHVTAYTPSWLASYVNRFGFRMVCMNTRCDVFWGSSEGILRYALLRLCGKTQEQAIRERYRSDRIYETSVLQKIDSVVSWYLDRLVKRIDYWGQMTVVFEKKVSHMTRPTESQLPISGEFT